MMEFIYKLRHKKTGLYYSPQAYFNKLSAKGKTYNKKPSIAYMGNSIRVSKEVLDMLHIESTAGKYDYMLPVEADDFEICQFVVVLHDTFPFTDKRKPQPEIISLTGKPMSKVDIGKFAKILDEFDELDSNR